MYSVKILRIGFASCAVLLLLVVSQVTAQPYTYIWDGTSTPVTTFWDTNGNWNVGTSGRFNNASPRAFDEEMGLLDNSLVTAAYTVSVRLNHDTLGAPPALHGRTVAGVTVGANATVGTPPIPAPLPVPVTATLDILGTTAGGGNTGKLYVVSTYGAAGLLPTPTNPLPPTVGTGSATINDTGSIMIQTGGLLSAVDNIIVNGGNLTVLPGGQAAAQNIDSNARGTIKLSGNAMLTSTFSSTLSGTTTITGPSVVFNASQVVLNSTSVFNPEITDASNHSILNVTGSVTLNGTLRPKFTAVTPSLDATWPLWDSQFVFGAFTGSDDSLTPLPTGHRYAAITTTTGTVHGIKGLLTVENFLTGEVNRANGQVTIRNTASTGGVTITGYQIASAAGALKPAGFTSSFQDDGFDGGEWVEAGTSANLFGELNASGNSLIATSSSNLLGSVYDPVPTLQRFGDAPPQDLVFTYARSDGRIATGAVTYINDGFTNTLILQVDPSDGKARIINNSNFNVEFDGYRVRSAGHSLNTSWNSLDDQNVGGADVWLEASPTADALSELSPSGTLAVSAGATAATMTGLFITGHPQDLQFDFRVPPTPGDYNSNGNVDVADYTSWRDTLGQIVNNPGDGADGNKSGTIDAGDYTVWKTNYGKVNGAGLLNSGVLNGVVRYQAFSGSGSGALGSSQVPEPSSLVLAAALTCGLLATRRRFNLVVKRQLCLVPAS